MPSGFGYWLIDLVSAGLGRAGHFVATEYFLQAAQAIVRIALHTYWHMVIFQTSFAFFTDVITHLAVAPIIYFWEPMLITLVICVRRGVIGCSRILREPTRLRQK